MSTGEITEINVEGVVITVQNYNQKPNSWAAAPKDLSGGLIDPNNYRLNVQAIEAFTGCSVDPVTVVNNGLQTIAAVNCS